MNPIRQLALNWIAQADEDEKAAITPLVPELVKESLLAWTRVRRNCAWELMARLQTTPEKEYLSEGHGAYSTSPKCP